MAKRSVSIAWKIYLVYGIYMGILGLLALTAPKVMYKAQFESFTGTTWAQFSEANAKIGDFIGLVFRFFGCMLLLVGIFKTFIGLYPYRKAEAWSWWTALIVGIVAYSFVFPYSIIVGDATTLTFNIIGVVLFLVAIILPAKAILSKKS